MAGKIAAVHVEESHAVKKGQILAELDQSMVAMRLAQAQARLEQTETEYERIKKMVEQNLMSLERLQQTKTNFALQKADRDLAQLVVDHTKIRAPFNGVIAWRHVDPGEWINTGGKIVDITQTDRVYVITSISEQHIRHIQKGIAASITCAAYPREIFTGNVHLLIPRADQNSHAFPIKIEVPNADGRLKSGMFARVDLAIDRADQVLLVPKDAVVNISGDKYVFVVEENKAKRIKIQTGRAEESYIEVEGDLAPETPVIVTGNETLRDGAEVRIINQN